MSGMRERRQAIQQHLAEQRAKVAAITEPPVGGLAEFLLARIAEDEAVAADEAIARVRAGTVVGGPGVTEQSVEQAQEGVRDIYRVRPWSSPWSSARVLAECEAKRRIVGQYTDAGWRGNWATCGALGEACLFLALPYADHPDYDEAWRP